MSSKGARSSRVRDLSPRQFAEAVGVSTSSVKRWCDEGHLATRRTAGGHRRMPISGVMAFLRARGLDPLRPDLLGLPAGAHRDAGALEAVEARVQGALRTGDGETVAATLFGLYLGGRTIAELADRLLAPAFAVLGQAWERGEVEVYAEHRAVACCTRALHELERALPAPPPSAPRALVATLAGDPYSLPLELATLALNEVGFQATSLGPDHPTETLLAALRTERPRLLAIAVNGVRPGGEPLIATAARLYAVAREQGTALVFGGRELDAASRTAVECTAVCDSMTALVALAASLGARPRRARRPQPIS